MLDITADEACRAAVLQRRFFVLVHSNNPGIRYEPVGAMPVMWNSDEWADGNRGCASGIRGRRSAPTLQSGSGRGSPGGGDASFLPVPPSLGLAVLQEVGTGLHKV